VTVVSGNITFMRTFVGVPWRLGINRQWDSRKRQFSGLSETTSLEPFH